MVLAASPSSAESPLSELISVANSRKNAGTHYQGEIMPAEAFAYLVKEGGMLVDVRMVPEWQFVGMPDLAGCKGQMAMVCLKNYPEMQENPRFMEQLAATGVSKETPLFFICRGGGRSSRAASLATEAGYLYCFNVATGFEGSSDPQGHRGRIDGWQGSGLPWKH